MIHTHDTPAYFWAEPLALLVIVPIVFHMNYGKEKKPNLKYFKIFGNRCYILKDGKKLGKFDSKFDLGIFLGYSTISKGYKVYNLNTKII